MGVKMLGARVKRIEDPRLLRGEAAYVDDLHQPGLLHLAILRSPHAHARLGTIELTRARALPGVVDAFTLHAFGEQPPAFPVLLPPPDAKPAPQFPLGRDRVRYVGEGVAVVVAESRAIAEDALDLIQVEYEVLEPVPSVEAALAGAAPVLHAGVPGNRYAEWSIGIGDIDAAFGEADVVIRERLAMQRYTGVPMETRGVLASHDRLTGELVVWASTQWPHTARALTAALLGIPEQQVRVILPEIGGGFGVKVEFYPEDLLVPFAARRLGRPVKWIEDRREHFQSTVHAREQVHEMELAVRRDGTILGLRDRILTDMGGYVRALGFINPSLASSSVPGPYRIPNVRIDSVAVLTNKTPVSPYRGAGQPEATFARERLLDIAAREIGIDPAELRRKNLLPPQALPYEVGLASVEGPVVYDSGDYPRALDVALETVGHAALRREQQAGQTDGRLLGLGLAVYAQISGNGPFEGAEVRVDGAGKVTLVTGLAAIGQGVGTALAQVVADELGVGLEDVRVVCGDTARLPFGVGTFASRAAVMGGTSTAAAAAKVRDKAVRLAAHLLEADREDIEWVDGQARVRGAPIRMLTLAQLAQAAGPGGSRPEGMEPSLEARHYFETHASPYSYGVHAAVVEVDAETGRVQVRRYVAVSDAGRLINPTIVEGQIVGGVAQGLGGALMEELAYDPSGQLVASSLMDYALPSACDVPEVEIVHLQTATPLNPLGIKGLGEGGAIGSHAAVANAVADALSECNARLTRTPLRAELVHALARTASTSLAAAPGG
jgi:aerobic carbon-monoxide dehydrogenase large subunit